MALAEGCSLVALRARCVALLAQKLRAEGPGWHERPSEAQLVDCGQEALLDLLDGWLAHSRAREVLEMAEPSSGCGGDTFGFTWALQAFSQRTTVAVSPWIAVGGHIWRLSLYPQVRAGPSPGPGLSVRLNCSCGTSFGTVLHV